MPEFRENPTTEEFMIKVLFFSVCKNSFVNSESNKMIGIMQFGKNFALGMGKLFQDCVL